MKFLITLECEDEFDRQAVIDCVKNKITIESLYSDVFRPKIKYGEDQQTTWQQVWEEVERYIDER
jgi:hypothetical protein